MRYKCRKDYWCIDRLRFIKNKEYNMTIGTDTFTPYNIIDEVGIPNEFTKFGLDMYFFKFKYGK